MCSSSGTRSHACPDLPPAASAPDRCPIQPVTTADHRLIARKAAEGKCGTNTLVAVGVQNPEEAFSGKARDCSCPNRSSRRQLARRPASRRRRTPDRRYRSPRCCCCPGSKGSRCETLTLYRPSCGLRTEPERRCGVATKIGQRDSIGSERECDIGVTSGSNTITE